MSTVKKSPKQVKESLKKAMASHNLQVERDNKVFDKLKPAEKRIFIARDVLKQLATKRIVAQQSTWVSPQGGGPVIPLKAMEQDKELKEVFDSMKSCHACALGGLFVCAVRINDHLKISEMQHVKTGSTDDEEDEMDRNHPSFRNVHLNDIEKYLGKFFSSNQLQLIELAFEGGDGGYDNDDSEEQEDAVTFFNDIYIEEGSSDSEVYFESEDRMRLIMQNIIANKGRFVPSKKPVARVSFSTPGFTS